MAARSPGETGAEGFRADLEGLRGVAIALVLLFHAGVPGTRGGFVGVDVFFVLSGFLITGLLVREQERSGRVDLVAFYARRARRILPAALAVIGATLLVAPAFLAPLDLPSLGADAIAAVLSVGNIRFAIDATDYFARDVAPSPLLHYWSLGVEEQFYLLWPALLIVAGRVARPRVGAAAILGVVTVASFAAAILLTADEPAWAFYSLPTRAWQLGLGGLLAVAWVGRATIPAWLAAAAGWAGLAAIGGAMVAVDVTTTPYPGLAALLPAIGAAGVIVGGEARDGPGWLLGTSPLRWLGRVSYSLYLVHWPVLVLPAAALPIGESLPAAERLGLMVLAIALGAASQRWIEAPFHRGARFALANRRVLAVAAGAIASVALVAVAFGAVADRRLTALAIDPSPSPTGTASTPSVSPEAAPSSTSSRSSIEPTSTPTSTVTPEPTPAPTPSPTPSPTPPGAQPLPADVQPPLANARDDRPRYVDAGCSVQETETQQPICPYGDPNGSITVVLLGDSHAGQWFTALDRISQERGWRLLPMTKNNCRFMDIAQYSTALKREYAECVTWRAVVVGLLGSIQPDLVVVANSKGVTPMDPADNAWERKTDGLVRALAPVPGQIALIVDTPRSDFDVPACLSAHLEDTRPCQTPRAHAFFRDQGRAEAAAAAAIGATLVDLNPIVCPGDPCPVVHDSMIMYRDQHHLTATFSDWLAPPLAEQLKL